MEMTRVGPAGEPSKMAEGNTENACTNDRQKHIARPGASSGREMWRDWGLRAAPGVETGRRELERGPDCRPLVVSGEKEFVVCERAALLRLERQDQPIEKRVDEQEHHERRCRKDQQQRAVELRSGCGVGGHVSWRPVSRA